MTALGGEADADGIGEWKLLTPMSGDRRNVTVEDGWEAFRFSGRADEDGSPISGDKVKFNAGKVNGAFTVTAIQPVK